MRLCFINVEKPEDIGAPANRRAVKYWSRVNSLPTRDSRLPRTTIAILPTPPKKRKSAPGRFVFKTRISHFAVTSDPFDSLPASADAFTHEMLQLYFNADTTSEPDRPRVSHLRLSRWVPLIHISKELMNALVAGLSTYFSPLPSFKTRLYSERATTTLIHTTLIVFARALKNIAMVPAQEAMALIFACGWLLAICLMQKDDTAAATHLHGLAAMMAQHPELCLDRQLINLGTSLSYYEEAFIHGHEFALPPPFWPDQDFVQTVLARDRIMGSALRQEGLGNVFSTELLEAADSLGACVALLDQLRYGSLALSPTVTINEIRMILYSHWALFRSTNPRYDDPINEATRLILVIVFYLQILDAARSAFVVNLACNLKVHLERLDMGHEIRKHPTFLLWSSMIGGLALNIGAPERVYFSRILTSLRASSLYGDSEHALDICRTFYWPSRLDEQAHVFWNSAIVESLNTTSHGESKVLKESQDAALFSADGNFRPFASLNTHDRSESNLTAIHICNRMDLMPNIEECFSGDLPHD